MEEIRVCTLMETWKFNGKDARPLKQPRFIEVMKVVKGALESTHN